MCLAKEGYISSQFTPSLFKHTTRDIAFSLVVDDFGVKYTKNEDAKQLIKTIMSRYDCKASCNHNFYLGITLEWDYEKRIYKLSIPEYVKQVLCKFQYITQQKCYSPSPYTPPIYGKEQYMAKMDTSALISAENKKLLQ